MCLKHLSLTKATLYCLHKQGLAACTALQLLESTESQVPSSNSEAIDTHDWFTARLSGVIGPLTSLQSLSLAYYVCPKLRWLSKLTSLQRLAISTQGCEFHLVEDLLPLTNLTCLKLRSSHRESGSAYLSLDVDWLNLSLLQRLSMSGVNIFPGKQTLQLAQLSHLTLVEFSGVILDALDTPYEQDAIDTPEKHHASRFQLMFNFAFLFPRLRCKFNGTLLCKACPGP